MRAMKAFHDRYLRRISRRDYRHMVLIDSNDPRGIDVAVMSRYKIDAVATHQDVEGEILFDDGPRHQRIFRRDCLEVHVKKNNKILPIFVCHFKSMMGGRGPTRPIRHAEATAVRDIIQERFNDPAHADWLVVGDLNDYTETDGVPDQDHGLGPLVDDGFSVDLVKKITEPINRWTHYYQGNDSYHQLDYMLASPSLASKNTSVKPTIVRQGLAYRAERYIGPRWPRTGYDQPKASDHCPVVAEISY